MENPIKTRRRSVDAPSIREIEARIDGMCDLATERHHRYEDRFTAQETAVQAALTAQEKFNSFVSAASKEAILKAEASQTGVNERSNEFRGQLADQAATLMPRKETEASLAAIRELVDREVHSIRSDITSLRESRSESTGVTSGRLSSQQFTAMVITLLIAIVTLALAFRRP